jgi:hypothetical protein
MHNPAWLPLCVASILLAAGCSSPREPIAPRPLTVIVSCDTAGWIVPCGCSSKQAGGLLRRASFVDIARRSSDVLLADAGGAPSGTSPYDRAKFKAVLQGEIAMQTVAHNIGAAEAELGAASLRELADDLHAPLITTNVHDASGEEFLPTHTLVSVGGKRFAVAGLLSPKFATPGVRIDDPQEALLRLIRSLKDQYDFLLVLAYLPEDELEALVTRVPEADIVVGGPTQQTIAPKRAGPAIWAATTNKGKFLVTLMRNDPSVGWTGKIVEMAPELADDPAQVENLNRFRAELDRTDFRADQTSFAPQLGDNLPADFRFAGTESCMQCHRGDCKQWSKTAHGHAWQTLTDKRAQMDSYCQQCHTTGYGLPGGFQSMATGAARHSVGCESCHGPGQAHVEKPTTHTIYNAMDRCTQCHDRENSPQFDYASYWAQIAHGEPATQDEER